MSWGFHSIEITGAIFLLMSTILLSIIRRKRIDTILSYRNPNTHLDRKYVDTLYGKYAQKLYYEGNIKKILPEMETLADELGLCYRLFRFIEDMRHCTNRGEDLSAWKSKTILQQEFVLNECSQPELINLFSHYFHFKQDNKIIEYNMDVLHSGHSKYRLFIGPPQFTHNRYHPVIIMGDKKQIYLVVKLFYEHTATSDLFLYYELIEFQSDYSDGWEWLNSLLTIMFEIRKENRGY
jgi:hypothetical protein